MQAVGTPFSLLGPFFSPQEVCRGGGRHRGKDTRRAGVSGGRGGLCAKVPVGSVRRTCVG